MISTKLKLQVCHKLSFLTVVKVCANSLRVGRNNEKYPEIPALTLQLSVNIQIGTQSVLSTVIRLSANN